MARKLRLDVKKHLDRSDISLGDLGETVVVNATTGSPSSRIHFPNQKSSSFTSAHTPLSNIKGKRIGEMSGSTGGVKGYLRYVNQGH